MSLGGVGGHALDGFFCRRAVERAGIDHLRAAREGGGERLRDVDFRVVEDGDDREAVLLREFEVSLVVRGDGHDGAGAVGHEHVVRDPDGDTAAVEGIDRVGAGEHARLFALGREALDFRLAARLHAVGIEGVAAVGRGDALDQRVFRGEDHEGGAIDRVRACGEDAKRFIDAGHVDAELERRALGAADPVGLHHLDALGPVDAIEAEEFFGVGGDAEEPLGQEAAFDDIVGALTAAVDDLFVGEHGLAAGAPVGGGFSPVGEAFFVELEEPPLRPFVVLGVAGDDLAVPVEGGAHHAELAAHAVDVGVGPCLRVDAAFDGGVFGREAESIEAHREEDVVALHAAVAGGRVAGCHGVPVAGVEVARGVGEHGEGVPLGARVVVRGVVEAVGEPALAPLGFDHGGVVAVGHGLLQGVARYRLRRGFGKAPPASGRGADQGSPVPSGPA